MKLGRVIGTVVATHKNEKLHGSRFLVLRKMNGSGEDLAGEDDYIVAVDPLGCAVDEVALYVVSSAARFATSVVDRPVDAVIVGIVDALEHAGQVRYEKSLAEA
ncbi:MAG: EutN/CcmL family microcompartment protein [Thermoleophilia bacterium]|nr:EutN/CcmL family microcompartment protein [Thermoleophilia bacterium]